MIDIKNQNKWDRFSFGYDLMVASGAEKRWKPTKLSVFSAMKKDKKILFMALGTGLDIELFPPKLDITAIDISPKMLARAKDRIAAYDGDLKATIMDVHDLKFEDNSFDQVFTACTFCSVPDPVNGLKSLKRVLKPGGELHMFEHMGSSHFPMNLMMKAMSPLASMVGPAMDRDTVGNVKKSGFKIVRVENIYMDIVRTVSAIAEK
ncbi:MAG: class I SAM-dependent methyltransferase [Gammaproteobacteria bacterium]|nr:class I SAM-dependent methyltransferase [Gammaproteobacteria bacterium]